MIAPLARSFFTSPTTPLGRNSVTSDEQRAQEVQPVFGRRDGQPALGAVDHEGAHDGADQVARPPTAAQMAISIELAGLISLGLMMPTCGTYSAPATPHIMAEMTQMVSL
jgi:hypothetical protein